MAFTGIKPKAEELTGTFESTRWKSASGDYLIGFLDDGTCVKGPVSEQSQLIQGLSYRFSGIWTTSSYGKQFQFRTFIQSEPQSRIGVAKYMEKVCPGIGHAIAHRLCDLYGADHAIGMLKANPEAVATAVGRLSEEKAKEAAAALVREQKWQETKVELMTLFDGLGFYGELVDYCISRWGVHAPRKVRRDPFCLLVPRKGPGCGFMRCDKLWFKLGLPSDRLKRQAVCAWFTVSEDSDGSVWMPLAQVVNGIEKRVTGVLRTEKAIELAVRGKILVRESIGSDVFIADARLARQESSIAERLGVLL